ncbi:BQ2448_8002 [Microbotryum intermedium]|uniref:BQ2448_8002 protein n=1 Tax=Microbotryum intermedium TaxID=269621 RepID=A0A238FSP7_9BASI|nr:BQ2448_8002 [Microbotryum intermedium]
MSERKGRGRGRRSVIDSSTSTPTAAAAASTLASPSKQPKFEDDDGDATMFDDPPGDIEMRALEDGGDEVPSTAGGAETSTSTSTSSKRISSITRSSTLANPRVRPVGGLLGGQNEYVQDVSRSVTPKLKFKPKNTRKNRPVVSDDEDDEVKMEEYDNSRSRGRGRGRGALAPRRELEMTASGPMAQGPGGAPKAFGSKRTFGPAGAGVMNASRGGTQLSGPSTNDAMQDADEDDEDEEDDDDGAGSNNGEGRQDGGMRMISRELDSIGREDEMAPLTLPRDPRVERLAAERRKERQLRKTKAEREAEMDVKAEPVDDSRASSIYLSSATATPGLETDSKAESKSPLLDEKKEHKQVNPEDMDLRPYFDLKPGDPEQMHILQFPRVFPKFVRADESTPAAAKDENLDVQPPQWGRAGTRKEKAARYSKEAGRIGEMRFHRNGKVTIKINNDLIYEILPAAQPSFLQEIALIDDKDLNDRPSPSDPYGRPTPSVVILGQTFNKFIAAPEASYLLGRIAEQDKGEKEAEMRLKAVKREKANQDA